METLEPILAAHPFFKDLDTASMALVVGCASNVRFDEGMLIFREGEDATQFFIIREGKVALELLVPGYGAVIVETVEAGEVLGWSWLFPPYFWRFNARVVEPVRAIALDGKCLRNKCERDHDFGYEMMTRFARVMQGRLSALTIQLTDIYAR
jgi:CRP/FNR family transcriptional regulator, cyclic AMP receptor protein